MTTHPAPNWDACFDDVARLAPWAEPNNWALTADERTEDAVLRAFGGCVSPDVEPGTPLLRWGNPDQPAVSLLDALVTGTKHAASHCDRCAARLSGKRNRLWVPSGQSVVELQMCGLCRNVLNDVCRQGDDRLLVWT